MVSVISMDYKAIPSSPPTISEYPSNKNSLEPPSIPSLLPNLPSMAPTVVVPTRAAVDYIEVN